MRPVHVLTAIASAGAGALHLGHASHHAADWPTLGLAFALTGWVQLLTAALVLLRPTRRLLVLVASANAIAVGAWALVHARGWPVGPLQGVVEETAMYDIATVVLELTAVAGAVLTYRRLTTADVRWRPLVAGMPLVATVGVVALTSLALAAPGATHGQAGDHPSGEHDHGGEVAGVSAAGDDHDDDHHDGVAHDHPPCTEEVTPTQQQAADDLLAQTEASLTRYADVEPALADGYELSVGPNGGPGSHYINPTYVLDGELLDPTRPESLVYLPIRGERVLIGAMYLATEGSEAPAPGGCLTRWHTHTNACIEAGRGIVAEVADDGSCPDGSQQRETMQMLHTWTIDVPDRFGVSLDRATLAPAIRAERQEG